jgi:RimJ/RimL family protein N-acetyltransferase
MIARPSGPTLVGERVILRPYAAGFDEEELRLLYAWARDPELLALSGGTYLELPYARFREIFLEKLVTLDASQELLYALLDLEGTLFGRIGLFGLDRRSHGAELGIVIGARERWSQGLGREAVGIIADHAFASLGLGHIALSVYPENQRARRAFAAAGFQVGRRVKRFSLDRGTHEELEMRLTAEDRKRISPSPLVGEGDGG